MAARIMVGAPVVSGALGVYPIGLEDDPRDVPRVLTLPEAIDAGQVVVHETGRVEQLAIEVTGDVPVLCVPGDLVVGGRQDRVVAAGAVVMRQAGKVRLPAFCVEWSRWERRGQESEDRFGSSTRAAPSSLRRLLVLGASQERVWDHVRSTQRDLTLVSTAGASIRDERSRTSLALSLDHPELGRDLQELVEPLLGLLPDEDVVGHAVVIGGRLSHAELFSSADLHGRVFRRLMESAAVDALAALPSSAVPGPEEIGAWLESAFRLPAAAATPAGAAWVTTRRGEDAICVETRLPAVAEPLHVLVMAD